jgi:hypothetical protein
MFIYFTINNKSIEIDMFEPFTASIAQLHSLMPDSILFGSILLYFLTHNLSFGIFAIFIMEVIASHKLLSWFFKGVAGPSTEQRTVTEKCMVGYNMTRTNIKRMFSHDLYPSYGVFSITAIGTYLGLATRSFSTTLSQMGTNWEWRGYIAYMFIALTILLVIIVRLITCDKGTEIMVAFLFALVTGVLFYLINKSIFGQESMNFLGLPYLVNKDDRGDTIYVCSPSSDPTRG